MLPLQDQMKENRLEIIINKSIGEVFDFCITPPKARFWVPDIVDEKTNEWPIRVGTIYTEIKKDKSSFNIVVTDFKKNKYIEWKTEDGKYVVRYTFEAIGLYKTQLVYVEGGKIENPFTNEILEKLKEVIEN